jgi:hypothetical protein
VTDSVLSSNCDAGASAAVRGRRSGSIHYRLRQRRFDTQGRRPSTCLATPFDSSLASRRRQDRSSTHFLRAQSETGYSQSLGPGIKRCLDISMVTSSPSCISSKPPPPRTLAAAIVELPPILPLCHASAPGPPYPEPRSDPRRSHSRACSEVTRPPQVAVGSLCVDSSASTILH